MCTYTRSKSDHIIIYPLHIINIIIGDAAYVGANYRTYLPMFVMGGMLFTVLVFHVILFRKLKPVETGRRNYQIIMENHVN